MKLLKLVLVALVGANIAACSHTGHYIDVESTAEGIAVTTTPDSNQATYIKTGSSDVRFCTETNIDYADTKSGGISTTFGFHGSTDEIGDKSTDAAVSFGGRDPAVLITRELMFRACELMANINADNRAAITIYAGTLDAIVKVAQSQQGTGTLPAAAPVAVPAVTDSDTAGSDVSTSKTPSPTLGAAAPTAFDWSSAFDYRDTYDPKHP